MKKGQIISLDFIFSIVLVILALGLLVRISEANNYRMKQEELFNELQRIGRTASVVLTDSEEFTCEVQDLSGTMLYNAINCLDLTKLNSKLSGVNAKANLLIPAEFEFKATIGANTWQSAPLNEANTPFYYSEERKIITHNGAMTKAEMENCFKNGCSEEKLKIWVWRSP